MDYRRELLSKSGKVISLLIYEASKTPRGTIIESHGSIGNSAELTAKESKRLIDYCLSQNLNYIAVDFSNNGTRPDQPENQVMFSDRIKDLETTMDFVQEQYRSPIILYGSSLGGHITINAANYSPVIKGIILNCPALIAFENVRETMDKEQFEGWSTKGQADYEFVNVSNIPYAFYEDLKAYVALTIIPKLKVPILIFQGTADKVTPVENAREAKRLNPHIELVEIEGGGHRFGDRMQTAEYIQKVESFIESILSSL